MNLPLHPAKASVQAIAERAQDHVDATRLATSLVALAAFGGRDDGGVSRETLTDIDLAARRHLIAQARALGCQVGIDDCGNLFFRRAGQRDLPPVLTGSHADTQPVGGKYDGAYGVLAGLEVIAALNAAGIETLRPVEVVSWTNEEGSRFGPGAMGSSAFVDPSRLAGYREAADQGGVRFGDALDAALADSDDVTRVPMARPMAACVELHIEQGPMLEAAHVPLGVVTGIQAVRWFEVTCVGTMAHAGTTPMAVRRDAMAVAVAIAQELYSMASRDTGASTTPGAPELRLTLGRWAVAPNSVNTIPGRVTFTVDMRCLDDAVLDHAEAALRATCLRLASSPDAVTVSRFFHRTPTHFPESMLGPIERACARASAQAGRAQPIRLTSGAFHDAMYLADHCPTAMIFVPSKGGISHNAAEDTDSAELFLGVQALAYTVAELASREP
ncbi:M20 family metallo-hydrolase [Cupriavidus agavae]|uniref:N-carbamoyl-L-amino-acid hydrolase n=1 Tax=Cupriavidus agavae TaxID=1001822 RepID=A0A4Q7RRJ3_9BURK|nr:M20 family metallo-hydrolase [Cupriavidus agavae]RZT35547.1 N-carbamoyl-L-amino-acid hydrolase [Cupriavidus agavae]